MTSVLESQLFIDIFSTARFDALTKHITRIPAEAHFDHFGAGTENHHFHHSLTTRALCCCLDRCSWMERATLSTSETIRKLNFEGSSSMTGLVQYRNSVLCVCSRKGAVRSSKDSQRCISEFLENVSAQRGTLLTIPCCYVQGLPVVARGVCFSILRQNT